MRKFRQFIIFALLALVASGAMADEVYISDTLRVGVRPSPSGTVAPFDVVTTGMSLQVLERVDGYLRIRTDDGVEGWIKDSYATKEAPAIIQLRAMQTRQVSLAEEIKQLKQELTIAAKANQVMSEQVSALKADKSRMQLELARHLGMGQLDEGHSVLWWLGIMVIPLFVLGAFYGGIIWYRNQAMKRLGGLRV